MSTHQFPTKNVKCSACHLKNICISTRLTDSEFEHLEHAVKKQEIVHKGEYIARAGEPFDAIFAVGSGSFKGMIIDDQGEQQITNFFLPGQLIGFNGIATGKHTSHIVALETSSICKLRFDMLEDMMSENPALHREVLRLMSKEIRQEQTQINHLSNKDAMSRLVIFILELSELHKYLGHSDTEFTLPMTRVDIGNYLALSSETVSRLVVKLNEEDFISIKNRYIKIDDIEALRAIIHAPR